MMDNKLPIWHFTSSKIQKHRLKMQMMVKGLVFGCLTSCVVTSVAQVERELINPEGRIIIHYKPSDEAKNLIAKNDLEYFWFDYTDVRQTMGGVGGPALDGKFVRFSKEGNLLEEGFFEHGLMTGLWKVWNDQGHLVSLVKWQEGKRHGTSENYDSEGELQSIEEYKKGMLDGKCRYLINGEWVDRIYKMGEERIRTKRFKKKLDVVPLTEDGTNEKEAE